MAKVVLRSAEEMLEHLDAAIASFNGDPADDDYQLGYLNAMKEMKKFVVKEE